jgi:hypothetical protein
MDFCVVQGQQHDRCSERTAISRIRTGRTNPEIHNRSPTNDGSQLSNVAGVVAPAADLKAATGQTTAAQHRAQQKQQQQSARDEQRLGPLSLHRHTYSKKKTPAATQRRLILVLPLTERDRIDDKHSE